MGTTMRAAVAAAVLLLVAGCSDGDPSPRDPSSTWSPTGTMETPTSAAPDPVEPELPAAAKEASEAGARAFIGYYWELINYAQVTGDVKALRAVSGKTCEGCQRAIRAVSELYSAGGRAEGGEYAIKVERVKDVSPKDQSAYGIEIALTARNAEQTIYRSDGNEEAVAPKDSTFVAYLIWVNSAWRTDVLESR